MRWFVASIALCVIIFLGSYSYLGYELAELQKFCSSLQAGSTVAQVRETAQERGFDAVMEPFTQMKIQTRIWDPASRSCRVFFNRDHAVEYRVWQGSK